MTATAHAVIGAAIVAKIPDLRISLPLALLSHFIGDIPDHWDVGDNWENTGLKKVAWRAFADLIVSYGLVLFFFVGWLKFDPIYIFLGAVTAQLPDYLEIPYFFLHWRGIPWKWVNDLQMLFHKKLPQIYLTATHQIILIIITILLVVLTK